uniref:Uncharacterized protein n=1 Tax=Arundo donax TaxID=35708 RepID=A0A0A9FLN3_ARUDO
MSADMSGTKCKISTTYNKKRYLRIWTSISNHSTKLTNRPDIMIIQLSGSKVSPDAKGRNSHWTKANRASLKMNHDFCHCDLFLTRVKV